MLAHFHLKSLETQLMCEVVFNRAQGFYGQKKPIWPKMLDSLLANSKFMPQKNAFFFSCKNIA